MKPFSKIYQRAAARKGGDEALEAMLAAALTGIKTPQALAKLGDDRYLAAITRAIFKAGFVWKVIDNKWPDFEQAFWQFNIKRCMFISPEDHEQLCKNARIVRNAQKIATVAHNATMIGDLAQEHGSFARFIANWPSDDYIGLLNLLKKRGSRLGGASCQYFLRDVGKDGFVLSRDGCAAMIDAGAIDKVPSSQSELKKVQAAYNQWQQESGRGLAEISRILAYSIDAP